MDKLASYSSDSDSELSNKSPPKRLKTEAGSSSTKSAQDLAAEWESFEKLIAGADDVVSIPTPVSVPAPVGIPAPVAAPDPLGIPLPVSVPGPATIPSSVWSPANGKQTDEGGGKDSVRKRKISTASEGKEKVKHLHNPNSSGSSGSSEDDDSEDSDEDSSEEDDSSEESDSEEETAKRNSKSANTKKKKQESSSSEEESESEDSSEDDSDDSKDSSEEDRKKKKVVKSKAKSPPSKSKRESHESPKRRSKSPSKNYRKRRSPSPVKSKLSRSHSRRSRSRSHTRSKHSPSRDQKKSSHTDRRRRGSSVDRKHRSRGSRHRSHRSRSRERRRRSRSRSRTRRKRSRSNDRHKRRHGRRPRSRSRSRSRSRRHGHEHRRRSPILTKAKKKKPLTYKEALRQKLIEAQKQAAEGKLECDPTGLFNLMSSNEKPSPLPLMSINPLMSLATGPPGGEKVTPQQAWLHTMAAMHQKAQQITGVAVPKYYNPAAVNPLKYAEQIKKRKLLWSKKDGSTEGEKPETAPVATVTEAPQPPPTVKVATPDDIPSVSTMPDGSQWKSGTAFIEDKDGKMEAKFRKLMGIKHDDSKDEEGASEHTVKKQQELFEHLDKEYQFARMTTHTHRGIGLGFTSLFPDTK